MFNMNSSVEMAHIVASIMILNSDMVFLCLWSLVATHKTSKCPLSNSQHQTGMSKNYYAEMIA